MHVREGTNLKFVLVDQDQVRPLAGLNRRNTVGKAERPRRLDGDEPERVRGVRCKGFALLSPAPANSRSRKVAPSRPTSPVQPLSTDDRNGGTP